MPNNKQLQSAKNNQSDEFYTQYSDIEKEMIHYKNYFKNKTVLCNCDNPKLSQFFKFFVDNFHKFGLKKLISVCYKKKQNWNLFSSSDDNNEEKATYCEYYGDNNIEIKELYGDGDFRSKESLKFLDEADVVVTNPPFSLFREFIALLIEKNKDFIVLGNMNTSSCKEIFPLFRDNKMWYGYSITSGDRKFYVPDDYELNAAGCGVDEEGKRFIKVKGVRWFTNIKYSENKDTVILTKKYNPEEYPKYDEYDAINVDSVKDIPVDYYEPIGVPITFLDKWESWAKIKGPFVVTANDFIIIGIDRYVENNPKIGHRFHIDGKEIYSRILIRRK